MKCKQCDSDKFISNNDNTKRNVMGLNIKRKVGERGLDSRETERVCERGRALLHECVVPVQRSTVLHKHVMEICKSISKNNDADNSLVSATRQLRFCYSHNDIYIRRQVAYSVY